MAATAATGRTELSVTSIEVISALVQEELRENAVLIPTLYDYSRMVVPGSDSVKIPRFNSLTAEDKGENTNLTAQLLNATMDTLNLDKYKASLVEIERIADAQSAVAVKEEAFRRIASSIVQAMEEEANTVLQATSASAPDHRVEYATGSTLAKADILNARKLLRLQNAWKNDGDMFMAIHPTQEEDILSISDFIHADTYGNPNGIQNGELGRIFGFRVVVSNNVTEDTSLFYHRTHAAFARQWDIQLEEDFVIDNLSDKYVGYALAGFVTLDGGKRGVRLENAI